MSKIEKITAASEVSTVALLVNEPVKLSLPEDVAADFAKDCVDASTAEARAIVRASKSKLDTVTDAAKAVLEALPSDARFTASDYDRLLGRKLSKALKLAVSKGRLTASTASKDSSVFKAITLAIVTGAAAPLEAQGFASFYETAKSALKAEAFAWVYGDAPKAGRKVGTGKRGGPTGETPVAPSGHTAEPSGSVSRDPGTAKVEAQRNGALALCNGDGKLADLLCLVMAKHRAAFIQWSATIVASN